MISLTAQEIDQLKQKSKELFSSMKILNKDIFIDEMEVHNLENVGINIVKLSLTFFHHDIETPHIDIEMIVTYENSSLGKYHVIFNSSHEVIDDFLIFD